MSSYVVQITYCAGFKSSGLNHPKSSEWHNEISLQWCHNERNGVPNHQPHDCLLKRLFRRRSKKTSKLRVAGLCAGNSPVTGEFPTQRASNAENASIWWRHRVTKLWQMTLPYSIRVTYFIRMTYVRCGGCLMDDIVCNLNSFVWLSANSFCHIHVRSHSQVTQMI